MKNLLPSRLESKLSVWARLSLSTSVLTAIFVASAAAYGGQVTYQITPLSLLPGDSLGLVSGLNNYGETVGNSGNRPVVWDSQGNPRELPTLPGYLSSPYASSVRLKVEQKQLVIDGTWNCLGGVGLQGA